MQSPMSILHVALVSTILMVGQVPIYQIFRPHSTHIEEYMDRYYKAIWGL